MRCSPPRDAPASDFEAADLQIAILARRRRPLALGHVDRRHVEQHHVEARAHVGGDRGDVVDVRDPSPSSTRPSEIRITDLGPSTAAEALQHFAHRRAARSASAVR